MDENEGKKSTNGGVNSLQEMISNSMTNFSSLWTSNDSCSTRTHAKIFNERGCAICLENFVRGDKICKSNHFLNKSESNDHCNNDKLRNEEESAKGTIFHENASIDVCDHAFHVDCMVQWLMKRYSEGMCPLCRLSFLSFEELENQNSPRRINNRGNGNHGPN